MIGYNIQQVTVFFMINRMDKHGRAIIMILGVSIITFSYPATKLNYPAITVCRKIPYNPDEYTRAVFDNFQLSCNNSCMEYCDASCEETEGLRQDFEHYIDLNYVRNL